MRSFSLIVAFSGAALAADGFVAFDLQRQVKRVARRSVDARGIDQPITENAAQSLYYLNMTVGTPPQPLRLQLDTGSSNVLFPNADNPTCQSECPSGSFNPNASSTYKLVQEGTFDISYGDGTEYKGDWFSDVITVGNIPLPAGSVNMGLANELIDGKIHNDGIGLVGVCYQALAEVPKNDSTVPDTIISAMVKTGVINRQAYSLWLNDRENGVGSIIFGGVDSSKYTGELVAIPMVPSPTDAPSGQTEYSRTIAPLTGISVTDADGVITVLNEPGLAVGANIDSGNSQQTIPQAIFDRISEGLGLSGNGNVPCSYANSNLTVNYQFGGEGGQTISVPLKALIDTQAGTEITFDDGTKGCSLQMSGGSEVALGDSFMRSGYFVYDLANNLLAMAQAKVDVTGSSVTSIPAGQEIPGCTSTDTFTINAATTSDAPTDTATATNTAAQNEPGSPTFNLGLSTPTGNTTTTKSGTGSLPTSTGTTTATSSLSGSGKSSSTLSTQPKGPTSASTSNGSGYGSPTGPSSTVGSQTTTTVTGSGSGGPSPPSGKPSGLPSGPPSGQPSPPPRGPPSSASTNTGGVGASTSQPYFNPWQPLPQSQPASSQINPASIAPASQAPSQPTSGSGFPTNNPFSGQPQPTSNPWQTQQPYPTQDCAVSFVTVTRTVRAGKGHHW